MNEIKKHRFKRLLEHKLNCGSNNIEYVIHLTNGTFNLSVKVMNKDSNPLKIESFNFNMSLIDNYSLEMLADYICARVRPKTIKININFEKGK